MIDSDDVKKAVIEEQWASFVCSPKTAHPMSLIFDFSVSGFQKYNISNLQAWIDHFDAVVFVPPVQRWRKPLYKIATSVAFMYLMYAIVCINIAETIVDFAMREDSSDPSASTTTEELYWTNVTLISTTAGISFMHTDSALTSSTELIANSIFAPSITNVHFFFLWANLGFAILYTIDATIKVRAK